MKPHFLRRCRAGRAVSPWARVMIVCACALVSPLRAAQENNDGFAALPESSGEKFAVIVGIDQYVDAGLSALPNALNDAEALYSVLTGAEMGFKKENVVLMTNRAAKLEHRPDLSNILATLDAWQHLAQPDDFLLFFFAGHGISESGELYLMPQFGRLAYLEQSSIPFSEIELRLRRSQANRFLIILDACHSGSAESRASRVADREMMARLEKNAELCLTFTSCAENEISHEYHRAGHGAFSWYLLEGLRGKADANGDALVTLRELLRHTTGGVMAWAMEQGIAQTPRQIGDISGDLILGSIRPRTELPSPPIAAQPVDTLAGPDRESWEPAMVHIPGGSFLMGSSAAQIKTAQELARRYGPRDVRSSRFKHEIPQRTVTIPAFYMSRYAITNAQYKQFLDETKYRIPKNSAPGIDEGLGIDLWTKQGFLPLYSKAPPLPGEDMPVVNISVSDADAYCKWLAGKTGKRYRLPSEAEWEYAAKSGKDRIFPWGDSWKHGEANIGVFLWDSGIIIDDDADGFQLWAPVYTYKPNEFGLHNMSGNTYEWCLPQSKKEGVIKGGSWRSLPIGARSADRIVIPQETRSFTVGFRVVYDP